MIMYDLVLLVLFSTIIVEAKVNPFGPTVSAEYTKCLSGLINGNFEKPGLIVVANTMDATTSVARIHEEILKVLHENIMFSVQVARPNETGEKCNNKTISCDNILVGQMRIHSVIPLAQYYVLVVGGFKEFKNIVDKLVTVRSWNPRAYFLVLVFRVMNIIEITEKRYPERILTYLFKLNVIDAVVIVPSKENYRNAIVFGWRPFKPPIYCAYHNETADDRLLVENVCEQGILKNENKLFEDKIPKDLSGCYLDLIALARQPFISDDPNDPNIEKLLIEEVAGIYKLKTKFELINDFRGEMDDNGAWTGALRHIVSGYGDALFGGVFPDFDVHEDFDGSTSYLADSYTWVVPRAYQSPPWVALIIIFKNFVWFSAAGTFVVCVFTWKILAVWSNDSRYHKSFDHCLLNTWYTTLGFASYMRPVRESLRVFFVFLNLYCVIFLTAYETKLIDVLTNPSFDKQIETIEELLESNLKFGGAEELHDLFLNSTDPVDAKVGEEWIHVLNVELALIDVVVHRNFSVLCSRLEINYLSAVMPELSDDLGMPTYYEFKRDMFNVPLEIVTSRGFHLMNKFSNLLNYFKQMGVIEMIRQTFSDLVLRRRANLFRKIHLKHAAASHEKPLSLEHLEGGFLALAVGYISGVMCLSCEIIWNSQYVKNKAEIVKKYCHQFRKNK